MSVNADYPHPVNVNGFSCKNCTDVDYAKKHIDPAHPKSGPYGVTADSDPTNEKSFIQLSGRLSAAQSVNTSAATTEQTTAAGQSVNILA